MELVPDSLRSVSCFIFAGRFGSGKTEVAINFALHWRRAQRRPDPSGRLALIDLDLVTPYFRSREAAETLRAQGIDVVAPADVSQHLDTPGVTPEILGRLQNDEAPVILDVGGDPQGARALGQYSSALRARGYAMYFVVNPYRPFTQDAEGIRIAILEIERTSRLLVTGLVSNPHIMSDTTPDAFARGQRLMEQASRQLALPIAFTALERKLYESMERPLGLDTPILLLDRFFALPWAEGS